MNIAEREKTITFLSLILNESKGRINQILQEVWLKGEHTSQTISNHIREVFPNKSDELHEAIRLFKKNNKIK